jgi:mRNA interferase MazF
MTSHRGDIVLVDLPYANVPGSKIRPVVIIQGDSHNARISNTIVAAITTNISRAGREPTHVLVDLATPDGQQTGLLATSVVACDNLFTVSQNRILRSIGSLPPALLASVDNGLKLSLGLR